MVLNNIRFYLEREIDSLKKMKKGLFVAFIIIIILTIGMFWFNQINYYLYYYPSGEYSEIECWEEDNVALIKVQGEMVTYDNWYGSVEGYEYDIVSSERVVRNIEDANERGHIEAIIVEVDSYGGMIVASEEIMNAIERSNKPVVAVIREHGLSGGYLAVSSADAIFASKLSNIGSISVTMSYLDYSEYLKEEGIIYHEITSGKFKDIGRSDKELTEEEREVLERNVEEAHKIFVEEVAENRNIESSKVEELADGSFMLGKKAREKGLVDEIGGTYEAKKWINEKLNIHPEICIY